MNEGTIHDPDTMMDFIFLTNTTEDADGIGDGWLVNDDLSKPTFECSVLLDVLSVLGKGSCADATKLTTSQEGLEQIGSVHTTSRLHDKMQLVDEENDTGALVRGLLNLVEDGLDTFLVLAAVRCASHQRAHVERVEPTEKRGGDIAVDDSLGEAFGDGSLTNTRLTDEYRVVLRPVR